MVDLMFRGGGIEPSKLQEIDPTDPPEGLQLVARALVRGQGKTEGYASAAYGCPNMYGEGYLNFQLIPLPRRRPSGSGSPGRCRTVY